jgi:hypothetical protein
MEWREKLRSATLILVPTTDGGMLPFKGRSDSGLIRRYVRSGRHSEANDKPFSRTN